MALNNRFMPLTWVVRTKVAPFSLSAPIQKAFQDAADLPVAHIRSMDQVVVSPPRATSSTRCCWASSLSSRFCWRPSGFTD